MLAKVLVSLHKMSAGSMKSVRQENAAFCSCTGACYFPVVSFFFFFIFFFFFLGYVHCHFKKMILTLWWDAGKRLSVQTGNTESWDSTWTEFQKDLPQLLSGRCMFWSGPFFLSVHWTAELHMELVVYVAEGSVDSWSTALPLSVKFTTQIHSWKCTVLPLTLILFFILF